MTEPITTTQDQSWLERFIDRNSWPLILLIGTVVVFYTTTNIKVQALESQVADLKNLVQRVIILEEQNKHEDQTLGEMRQDVKDIKKQMELHLMQK